jgi:hypothetical protein
MLRFIICSLLLLTSCGVHLPEVPMAGDLYDIGVLVNINNPSEDSLIITSGFKFITRDSSGKRIEFIGHLKDQSTFGMCADCGDNFLVLNSNDGKKWICSPIVEKRGKCNQFLQFTQFCGSRIPGVDNREIIRIWYWGRKDTLDHQRQWYDELQNSHGDLYKFVKCIP